MEVCDRLTVLRDGRVVGTVETADVTMEGLKRMMVGREMAGDYYRDDDAPSCGEAKVLSVRGLTVGDEVQDVCFDLHEGEIVGLCGLSDSGIHTVGKALYGLADGAAGEVRLCGRDGAAGTRISSPQQALRLGMAYVPKERDWEGLMTRAGVRENLTLPSLDGLQSRLGLIWHSRMDSAAQEAVDSFDIRCGSVRQETGGLSGGNKQKVNLGRWAARRLSCLILDCPTRGVDVGAKAYIYGLMKRLKAEGLGMILISDELLEALGMADRILVVKGGRIVREIPRGPQFTEETVIEVMV
jgi:ribose transport system ATP-binding protein